MDLAVISFTVLALLIAYSFLKRRNVFQVAGVPFKRSLPLLGSVWEPLFGFKSLPNVIQEIYNSYPDAKYIGFHNRMTPTLMIRDPDLIKSIGTKHFDHFRNHRNFGNENNETFLSKNLLLLRNERWKEIRSLMTPAFTASKMRSMYKLMSETAANVARYLSDLPSDQTVVEMKDVFTRYTNDVFASCAFGIAIDSLHDRCNEFYTLGTEVLDIHRVGVFKLIMVRLFPGLSRKLGVTLVNRRTVRFFTEIVASNIESRKEQGIVRPDFIQTMTETRQRLGTGKELTIEDIAAQAFAFFFGGFETTSGLLCFAAHELAMNLPVQEKLRNEIQQVLQNSQGEITYEQLNGMKYLDAVVNETLRLYPVIPMTDRECSKRFELPPARPGLKPYIVEQGSHVWFPIYAIQRDPSYFRKPDNFDPDKFLDQDHDTLNPATYLPFGLGPRICIGNRFSILETKVALFHILARCRLNVCERTIRPMEFERRKVFLTAKDGFWLKITA